MKNKVSQPESMSSSSDEADLNIPSTARVQYIVDGADTPVLSIATRNTRYIAPQLLLRSTALQFLLEHVSRRNQPVKQ